MNEAIWVFFAGSVVGVFVSVAIRFAFDVFDTSDTYLITKAIENKLLKERKAKYKAYKVILDAFDKASSELSNTDWTEL